MTMRNKAISSLCIFAARGAKRIGIMTRYRISQAVAKTLIIEKRLTRYFPTGIKKKAEKTKALIIPIVVEVAPKRRAYSVIKFPLSSVNEKALKELKKL